MKTSALVLDPADNVATVLADVNPGETCAMKGVNASIVSAANIPFGHKIAVKTIRSGDEILKYGQRIGLATVDITPGEWVHLHNMRSALDTHFRERIGR